MKKVLLINPNKDFFSNPMLVLLLDELIDQHIEVHLIHPPQFVDLPTKYSNFKHIEFTAFNVSWSKKLWKSFSVLRSYWKVIRYCKKNELSSIIGIDPTGIIIAGRIHKFLTKSDLHYLSFELFFKDELKEEKSYLRIKKKELKYVRKIKSLLIQDEVRFDLLRQENKLNPSEFKTFFIPVSPKKIEFTKEEKAYWKKYYREKLGVQKDQIVLIHSGSVARWGGGDILLKLLDLELPEKYIVLIHSKFALDQSNELYKELLKKKEKNFPLILHTEPFSDYEEYIRFLLLADIGLVLYEADFQSPYTGKNIENIGLSSGKFACYMSLGLPSIVTYSKTYEILNTKYNVGIVVKNEIEIKDWLMNQYPSLSESGGSTKLYDQELNNEQRIKAYIDFIS